MAASAAVLFFETKEERGVGSRSAKEESKEVKSFRGLEASFFLPTPRPLLSLSSFSRFRAGSEVQFSLDDADHSDDAGLLLARLGDCETAAAQERRAAPPPLPRREIDARRHRRCEWGIADSLALRNLEYVNRASQRMEDIELCVLPPKF
jgi:hypothetical protein